MNIVRARRGHAGQVEQPEGDRLIQSVFAASSIAALLNARPEIELLPFRRVRPSEIIARLEMMAAGKIELPHVLAHRMPPFAAADAKPNMIVDPAVRHDCAGVPVVM